MATGIQSAEQFKLISITMDSEKFSRPLILAGSNSQTPIVVEFNIYESIVSPFLTGDILLQDDQDIQRVANLSGTERITFEFTSPTQDDQIISKTFVVTSILNSTKTNDYTNLLTLKLIEDIGFYNNINRFSKTYDGKGEQIIRKIVEDNLNRSVNVVNSRESFQKAFRYIVPHQTPFEAIRTVLYKMTTDLGMPYFFFSSLTSDDFILSDLQSIISKTPFNESRPFMYSQAVTNSDVNDLAGKAVSISNFDGYNLEDTQLLAQLGAIGSFYSNINITTGQTYKAHQDQVENFNILLRNSIIPQQYRALLVDQLFISDPSGNDTRRLQDFNSRVFSEVSASTFPYDPSLNGFSEEEFIFFNRLRLVRNNFIHHMFKNVYRMYVPGLLFSYKNVNTSVGNQIDINVLRNQILQPGMGVDRVIDQSRSGRFIILAKRHLFNITSDTHNVSLEISRVSNLENTE